MFKITSEIMTVKSGVLKSIIIFFIVTTMKYRNIATDATRVVNVRNTHKMQSRSLLFPPTAPTRVQFIGGIGIPVEDLYFESVTSGYVLKAEYLLPETADVFHQNIKPQTIHRRRKSLNETNSYQDMHESIFSNRTFSLSQNMEYDYYKNLREAEDNSLKTQQKRTSLYRWIVYKAIETVLNKSALNGHACMLRSICEHAAIPLSYEGGLLAEILHIILTPSSSRDKPVKPDHKNYLRAEVLGRVGKDCAKAYNLCSKSPMQIISAVFQI